jgi:hypothetical protein
MTAPRPPATRLHNALVIALVAALATACADEPSTSAPGLQLHFAALAAGGCEAHPNGSGKLPAEIATLSAVIEIGNSVTDPQRISAAKVESGRWVIGPLPAAKDPTEQADVIVYGCDSANKVIYQGRSNGTLIPDQSDANVKMFLVPVGKLACTGNKAVNTAQGQSHHLNTARSFIATAVMANGDVVATGGIGDWDGATRKGLGSLDTEIYRHDGGFFRKGPALLDKRIWHHAIALNEAKVLVVGGVTEVAAQGGLPSPLLAPSNIPAALPKNKAEIISVVANAAGTFEQTQVADKVDVGVGALFMSSAIKTGDTVTFVGGIEAADKVANRATRVSDFAGIAAGNAGKSETLNLNVPRIRPGLLAFADGTIVVWGGSQKGNDDIGELGELLLPNSATATAIKVTGAAALMADPLIASYAPTVVMLSRTDTTMIFVVTGGMPRQSVTNATAAMSYLVVLDKAGTASLKELDLGGIKLHAGLGAGAAHLVSGHALIAGGLIGLSGVAPCDAGASECLLGSATLLLPPSSTDGDKVTLDAKTVDLGAVRAGIAITPLPAGALLLGGQSSIVTGTDKGPDALDPSGKVLAGELSTEAEKKICGG